MAELPIYSQQTTYQPVDVTKGYMGGVIGDYSGKYWEKITTDLNSTLDQIGTKLGQTQGTKDQTALDPNATPTSAGFLVGLTPYGKAYNEAATKVTNIQKEGQFAEAASAAVNQFPTDPAQARAAFADASAKIVSNVPTDMSQGVSLLQQQYASHVGQVAEQKLQDYNKGNAIDAAQDEFNKLAQTIRTAPENSPEHALAAQQIASLIGNGAKLGYWTPQQGQQMRDSANYYRILGIADQSINSRAQLDALKQGKTTIGGMDTLPINMKLNLFQTVDNEVTRREREARMNQALAAQDAQFKAANLVANIKENGPQPGLQNQLIATVQGSSPAHAEALSAQFEAATISYNINKGQFAQSPAAEVQTYLESIKPGQNDPHFLRKEAVYQTGMQALVARNTRAQSGDVMSVAYAGNPSAMVNFQSQNGALVQGTITHGIELATKMGYGEIAMANPLPLAMAEALGKQYQAATDDQRIALLGQIRARFGQPAGSNMPDYSNAVISQMIAKGGVDPSAQLIMTYPTGGATSPADSAASKSDLLDWVDSTKVPKEQLAKDAGLTDPAFKQNLATALNGVVGPGKGLYGTFVAQGADKLAYATRDSAERLAMLYVSRGMDTSAAVMKANSVVSRGFDVSQDGKYRVPAGSLNSAEYMTDQALTNMKPDDLLVKPIPDSKFSQSETEGQVLNRVRATAFWITNTNGTGIQLMYQPLAQFPSLVQPVPMKANGGSNYTITYQQIKQNKQTGSAAPLSVSPTGIAFGDEGR